MNQHDAKNNGHAGKSRPAGRGKTKINWTDQPQNDDSSKQDSPVTDSAQNPSDKDLRAHGGDASPEQMAGQNDQAADQAPEPQGDPSGETGEWAADFDDVVANDPGATATGETELAGDDQASEGQAGGNQAGADQAGGDQTSDDAVRRAEELEQRLLRTVADYQNLARRSRLDVESARKQQAMEMARSLLSVLDNFDHALAVDPKKTDAQSLLKGVTMVRDELLRALESFEIRRLDVEPGTEFDPNCHEAMMRQPAEGIDTNHVTQQLQPGYTIGEKTLRPAKVAVAP